MTTARIIEVVVAVALLIAGVWLYRRRDKADSYGSQSAVILFVVGAIAAVHGLGLLDYRPSQSELESLQERAR